MWLLTALGLWVLLVEAWFQGPFLDGRLGDRGSLILALALVAALAASGVRRLKLARGAGSPDARFGAMAAGILLLATVVRLPVFAAPGSVISSDSAVAGIIAQELRAGERPAPIYAPGFAYEGTLKPHLTALLGAWLPSVGTPFLYTLSSHLFHLVWILAVMALARRTAGNVAAAAAGLFLAVSPRFLTAFSLNNVGQYPEVNALGAVALAILAGSGSLVLSGFTLGLAVWQQLLGIYFVLTATVAVLLTPSLRQPGKMAAGLLGFACGSYPIWIWNVANGWATFDWVRRGGKNPTDRLTGLPDRLEKVATESFPRLFGLTDLGLPDAAAAVLGLALPALVLWTAWRWRREMWEERARSPLFLVCLLFVVVVGVFAASKFSHRGTRRPRYLLPIYTSVAVAGGVALEALSRRSRMAAAVAGATVLVVNAAGLVPWMRSRADAESHDRAFLQGLLDHGVRTGYADFWLAPKYTFLADGKLVLSGELGPGVSWVHWRHAARVREEGPDGYVVGSEDLAQALARRLEALGCRFERTEVVGHWVFHHLSRRVTIEEVSGYDADLSPMTQPEEPGPAA